MAKKIPFDDPNVLNACRAVYIASNLIIISIYFYIKSVVDKKKGTSLVAPSDIPCRTMEFSEGGPCAQTFAPR